MCLTEPPLIAAIASSLNHKHLQSQFKESFRFLEVTYMTKTEQVLIHSDSEKSY